MNRSLEVRPVLSCWKIVSPFTFSALPGRHAAQIIGITAIVGFSAARFLLAEWFGQLTTALIIMLAYWLGSAKATREPWLRESGVNLEATRGSPARFR